MNLQTLRWPPHVCDEVARRGGRAGSLLGWAMGALLGLALATAACRLKTEPDPPAPIVECEQYQEAFSRCTGDPVKLPLARAETLVNKSEKEREEMRSLCAVNLKRIQTACR